MAAFKAAAVQMRSGTDVAENVAAAEKLVREAARAGADYVLTPEMTTILDRDREHLLASISPEENDPSLARFRALARELGIHLHIGSMAVRLPGQNVANRGFVLGPDGRTLQTYDKIHMYDVDLGNGESYRESRLYRPGGAAKVADLPWARLGMSVCYDVRFPNLYRVLARYGASAIAIPAAFTQTTGQAHWHVLVRARAIETGCYVIAAAQGGHHADGRDTYGHSMIVDPWGAILAEAGTEPGVILAGIDPDESARARQRVPALANEREFTPPAEASRPAAPVRELS
ncbi:MAG TPA: carbon-nitrogen hydrolase family protein [Bauldia sp.]|nr:carbon-nitrogen hydrolase family protein [Bauldia sp.]